MTIAANNPFSALRYGYAPASLVAGVSASALTSNAHKVAFSFSSAKSRNASKFEVFQSAGSAGVALVWSLCPDVAGVPNTGSPLVPETACTSPGTGAILAIDASAILPLVSAENRYWLVIRNTTATSVSFGYTATSPYGSFANNWMKRQDFGVGNWTASGVAFGVCGLIVTYSDNSVEGLCCTDIGLTADKGYGNSNLTGARLTTPPNISLNVIGIGGLVAGAGSPTGNIIGKIFFGATEKVAANTLTPVTELTGVTGSQGQSVLLNANFTIPPSTDIRIAFSASSGDTNNYLRPARTAFYTNSNDSRYLALRPSGNLRKTVLASGVWTDTESECPFMWLLLDPTQPFLPVGGGNRGIMTGGRL